MEERDGGPWATLQEELGKRGSASARRRYEARLQLEGLSSREVALVTTVEAMGEKRRKPQAPRVHCPLQGTTTKVDAQAFEAWSHAFWK